MRLTTTEHTVAWRLVRMRVLTWVWAGAAALVTSPRAMVGLWEEHGRQGQTGAGSHPHSATWQLCDVGQVA